MNHYLAQFQKLKPQERRFVVGVILVMFLVLNFFFVWPYFSSLDLERTKMGKAEDTLKKFKAELARKPVYEARVKDLQKEGMDVPPEDQEVHFDRTFRNLAVENKVTIVSSARTVTRTNDFFLEKEAGINVIAGEKDLVYFLYSLGTGDSLMRVRGLSLRPDPSHMQLSAGLTIVASYQYQKKAPPHSATPPAKPVVAAAEKPKTAPAANPAKPLPTGKVNAVTNKSASTTAKRP